MAKTFRSWKSGGQDELDSKIRKAASSRVWIYLGLWLICSIIVIVGTQTMGTLYWIGFIGMGVFMGTATITRNTMKVVCDGKRSGGLIALIMILFGGIIVPFAIVWLLQRTVGLTLTVMGWSGYRNQVLG